MGRHNLVSDRFGLGGRRDWTVKRFGVFVTTNISLLGTLLQLRHLDYLYMLRHFGSSLW